jgi:membrane protein implicated in regulation of membrane protease activity
MIHLTLECVLFLFIAIAGIAALFVVGTLGIALCVSAVEEYARTPIQYRYGLWIAFAGLSAMAVYRVLDSISLQRRAALRGAIQLPTAVGSRET